MSDSDKHPRPAVDLSLGSIASFGQKLAKTISELANPDAPEVQIGPTSRQLIFETGPARLYYYGNSTGPAERETRTSVLLVPSLINRPVIFDLIPGRSFVAGLCAAEIDVYLLDWGIPGDADALTTFDEYITGYYHETVEYLKIFSGRDSVSILGYCIGGLLSLIYSALYPTNVKALVNLASPVDFSEAGIMRSWVDKTGVKIESLVNAHGNIPPSFLLLVFSMLKPTSKATAFRMFFERNDDTQFNHFHRAMEHWANTNIPFPGTFGLRYIKEFYVENRLLRGELMVGGNTVDLSAYKNPFLNIMADPDHIVPLAAAKKAEQLVGSQDIESWVFPTGHVGLMVGSKSIQNMWPRLQTWLKKNDAL